MNIKIDKDIPLPPRGRRLPLDQLDIGDSFLIPAGMSHAYVRQLIQNAQKRLSRNFSLRRTKDGYRCWRIEDGDRD